MKSDPHVFDSLWPKLEALAVEKEILDAVDVALIQSLCRYIIRPTDLAFPTVVACLLKSLHAGGLRITLEVDGLTLLCQEFLASLFKGINDPSALSNVQHEPIDPELLTAAENIPALARRMAEEFTQNRLSGAYASVIGHPSDFLPLIQSGGGLYFQKHQSAEAAVGLKLKQLLAAGDVDIPENNGKEILQTILVKLPLRLKIDLELRPMVFDDAQKTALHMALRKRFTVISGGPGTGKTSLAANLLRAWVRSWMLKRTAYRNNSTEIAPALPRIRLAAPTGRAAQRLVEAIQRSLKGIHYPTPESPEFMLDQFISKLPGETLHSLLRYNPGTGEYFYRTHRSLPADLIVVDEVSMVDVFVFARLLNALEEDACLVILGDKDQLPSIDSGSILRDLIPENDSIRNSLLDNTVILDTSHRSESGILNVTRKINAQDAIGALECMGPPLSLAPDAETALFKGGGCRFLLPNTPENSGLEHRLSWKPWLEAWVDFHYLGHSAYSTLVAKMSAFRSMEGEEFNLALAELFNCLDQARILTFTRNGWHGCTTINQSIRANAIRKWDPMAAIRSAEGFHGSPILILQNDYSKNLFNGDVGIFLRMQGRPMGFFRRGDEFIHFPAAFLPRHETAFAMTIHKSQGSEYDQILLVLPDSGNRLLAKETLYTAITRARNFAGIYGSREVFLEAVAHKVMRESGLSQYLEPKG